MTPAKLVTVKFTNGFGNNIFQYTAAKLFGARLDYAVQAIPPSPDYYAIEDLKALGVQFVSEDFHYRSDTVYITDDNFIQKFSDPGRSGRFHLTGYFEDYRYYFNNLSRIRDWYGAVDTRQDNALVLHMRTGDRLFMKNEFYSKPRVENYLQAIEKFDFDEFHIVTDMPTWTKVTGEELQNMRFHVNTPEENRVPIEDSVSYFNELVEGFAKYNPQITQRTVGEDFNFMRKFKNILFEHGTLSWWAAVLSDAQKVGVYGPWRPWKGASNKNLSQIPLPGWFKWE
jgi:hypothetical protein